MQTCEITIELASHGLQESKTIATMIRAIHWCSTYATNNHSWDQLREISPDARLPFPYNLSRWQLMHWLDKEAKLEIRRYDCCVNGCKAYTDGYEEASVCDSCDEPRYRYVSRLHARVSGPRGCND